MSNIDLNFVKNQMDLAIKRCDINSFKKWSDIWYGEHRRIRRESMARVQNTLNKLNMDIYNDMEMIKSWAK